MDGRGERDRINKSAQDRSLTLAVASLIDNEKTSREATAGGRQIGRIRTSFAEGARLARHGNDHEQITMKLPCKSQKFPQITMKLPWINHGLSRAGIDAINSSAANTSALYHRLHGGYCNRDFPIARAGGSLGALCNRDFPIAYCAGHFFPITPFLDSKRLSEHLYQFLTRLIYPLS